MIKFDKDEFLKPQIYSTNDEYKTRCRVTNEVVNDVKNLQQRIDKAIEYIENDLQSFLYSIEYKTLLEILKGGEYNE